jgi:hypothetical protein
LAAEILRHYRQPTIQYEMTILCARDTQEPGHPGGAVGSGSEPIPG